MADKASTGNTPNDLGYLLIVGNREWKTTEIIFRRQRSQLKESPTYQIWVNQVSMRIITTTDRNTLRERES